MAVERSLCQQRRPLFFKSILLILSVVFRNEERLEFYETERQLWSGCQILKKSNW
jgi:hypothetical protein